MRATTNMPRQAPSSGTRARAAAVMIALALVVAVPGVSGAFPLDVAKEARQLGQRKGSKKNGGICCVSCIVLYPVGVWKLSNSRTKFCDVAVGVALLSADRDSVMTAVPEPCPILMHGE